MRGINYPGINLTALGDRAATSLTTAIQAGWRFHAGAGFLITPSFLADWMPYWNGKSSALARDSIFHYYESKLTALRMGPWKFHFSTKEGYYDNVSPRPVPLVFNLRMDPFESYDSNDSYGHLMQKVYWLIQPAGELMGEHLKTLAEFPPVQYGKTFDMSNIVEQFVKKAKQ